MLRRRTVRYAPLAATALAIAGLTTLVPASAAPAGSAAVGASTVTTQVNPGWGLDRLDERSRPLDWRYRARSTGAGVTAYVIDCGMQTSNAEFSGRAVKGANIAGGSWTDCADESAVGHATFVGGIIGGRSTGVAKQVRLVAVRTLVGGEGQPSPPEPTERAAVIRAIKWVIADAAGQHRPAVVSMSLSFSRPHQFDVAMGLLERAGITAVVAAGNDDGYACAHAPADTPTALVVGASTSTDRRWEGSNYGRCVDLFAPGLNVRSVLSGGGVFRYDGSGATSWATPYVTGAVALYLSQHPTATPHQVRAWIQDNATTGQLQGLAALTSDRLLYSFGPM